MDQDTFARKVTDMQGGLYRVAASYLRGESDRLDAVAEAIARAWEKRHTLRDERLFRTWITRILIRECVNIQRRQKRSVPVDALPEAASEPEDERIAALREALAQLPQRQRTMIVLHYMEGYDVREVARIMGTTKSAVFAGLSRARTRLRDWFSRTRWTQRQRPGRRWLSSTALHRRWRASLRARSPRMGARWSLRPWRIRARGLKESSACTP